MNVASVKLSYYAAGLLAGRGEHDIINRLRQINGNVAIVNSNKVKISYYFNGVLFYFWLQVGFIKLLSKMLTKSK